MKKTHPIPLALKPAALAAGLFLFSLPASAQLIFNGNNTISGEVGTWDTGFRVAFGEGQDGRLDFLASDITASPEILLADSDGTGTSNTAELNIDFASRLNLSSGGIAQFGSDGAATVNIADGGLLETRQVILGALPGSSGTVNLSGFSALWNQRSWFVDVGRAGTGEVNVLDGARISTAQRFVIGGSFSSLVESGGTGSLTVDGWGSEINFANSGLGFLAIGGRGTGTATVSNGGIINATGTTNQQDVWVGRWEGGTGNLIINSGGVVNTDGVFRVASVSSNSSTATVDGAGSGLNVGQWAFVGNTGAEGTIGTLNVTNGGLIDISSSLRVGNQVGATGIVNVGGIGSKLNLGTYLSLGVDGDGTANITDGGEVKAETYLHVGASGEGRLNLSEGGKLEVGTLPETTFGAFIGRFEGGSGTVEIADSGSALISTHSLFLGAGPEGEATGGFGALVVRNSGSVTVGVNLFVRGDSSVELDGGSIVVQSGSFFQDNASLTGEGSLESDLSIESNASILGSGAGIAVSGILSGTGSVENIGVGGVEVVSSAGPLVLNKVSFSGGAAINLTLDGLDAQNLISFNGETSFGGLSLVVAFAEIDPASKAAFALFDYTGAGEATYDFANITTPDGWFFEDGWLYNQDPAPGSAFQDWAELYSLAGEDAAINADPDGDGFTNFQEFAFGTDPTVPTTSLVQVSGDGATLTLRWNRSLEPGANYLIQQSEDLASWSPVVGAVPVAMEIPDLAPPVGYERVEWSVELAATGARSFYRVETDFDSSLLP